MTTKTTVAWLARVGEPRTIDSLILEVYGETVFYGCLFEQNVADLLNYYESAVDLIGSLGKPLYDTRRYSLNQLIAEVEKRGFLTDEQLTIFREGREARNESVHRLIGVELVISTTEKELLVEKIAALQFRIWRASKFSAKLRDQFAEKVGVTSEKMQQLKIRLTEEARVEDENIRRILGLNENSQEG